VGRPRGAGAGRLAHQPIALTYPQTDHERDPMSSSSTPQPRATGEFRPSRRSIATYNSYEDAQRAVDFLSDRQFPVERVSIIGRDLHYIEQVTGRLTTARAALAGGLQGALIGFLFGALFGLFFTLPEAYVLVLLYGVVAGALFGALIGAIAHAATGGRRDFSAVQGIGANRYELLVDEEVADEAVRLLAELSPPPSRAVPGNGAAAAAQDRERLGSR
jgi:hypothetical protein